MWQAARPRAERRSQPDGRKPKTPARLGQPPQSRYAYPIMSDITIRFDGLALLATLAFSTLAYALIALAAFVARSRRTARSAACMTAATLALTVVFLVYWLRQGTAHTGPDTVDTLVFPWTAVFLAGCHRLIHDGRA